MSNRLISETSPYLLQHAENPVDWYPWGDEAFAKARSEDKPIFLSVGYSACHWCHVMAHESFENATTAELMNQHFVSIKVDREERPDVDAIYMDAVQALTGRGGWPMSVFLTPEAVPFYGGTYFPGVAHHGMPSFAEVLQQVARLWDTRRAELVDAGATLTVALKERADFGEGSTRGPLGNETLDVAARELSRAFDRVNGGWGTAPKFPQPAILEFLLRRHVATGNRETLQMVTKTLDSMMRGGIYDQLGGGFHRYSTDAIWLVPHFEKMLYDNAQLARLYLHAWQVTENTNYRRVAEETLDYVVREMLDPAGGFYSAQDADSEGVEGRFFVWTPEEIRAVLGQDSAGELKSSELFMDVYGVSDCGNFEDSNILFVARTPSDVAQDRDLEVAQVQSQLAQARQSLLQARDKRVKPGLDDKVLASWNGLMLAAFAEAARVLNRDDYREIAERNAEFLLSSMRDEDGRMLRTWKNGDSKLNGYLEDYANVADGLLELYQTTFEHRWFTETRSLADVILAHFTDHAGGFFDTSDDHERLIVRPKDLEDGAVPSGGAVASQLLLKLAHYTGDATYSQAAAGAVTPIRPAMEKAPLGFSAWLCALDLALSPPQELALIGDDTDELLQVARAEYRPNLLVAAGPPGSDGDIALLEGREPVNGQPTAYVCHQFTCEPPVTTPAELEVLLGK